MDVDEGDKSINQTQKNRGNSFNQSDYIWTIEKAQELLNEFDLAQSLNKTLFVDKKLITSVKDRVNNLINLKKEV